MNIFCNLLDSMASTVLCVNDWVLLFKMHLVMNSIVGVLYSSIISILKGKNNWLIVKLWLTQFHLDQPVFRVFFSFKVQVLQITLPFFVKDQFT